MSNQATSSTLQPHNRQFVIGPKAFRAYDDWCCRQISASTWISHCPNLRTGWAIDADGYSWSLLGLATETLEDRADPLLEIARHPSADIPNLYSSWAGRWVLVGREQVHMDASGLLGCFYGKAHQQTWVSSSPALLVQILSSGAELHIDPRSLRYRKGLSWFTPPRSRFEEIRRLLPSQVVHLDTGDIQSRSLIPAIDPTRSYDETLELLKQSLITALRRLPVDNNEIWLSLSAGVDSRLIFAMSHCAELHSVPFTRIAARMSLADRLLPPKLAQELGYQHVFFRGGSGQQRRDRQQIVMEHTAGHVSEGDALPLLQGVRDSLKGIAIGGQCFGVGKVLGRKYPASIDNPEVAAQQIAALIEEPTTSSAVTGIREWLEWVLKTPHQHLDWRDRFYIEQRLAGWQSAKEQLYDLVQLERFFPINSARNYALLLEIDESYRIGAQHQLDLIKKTVPQLLKDPCNPPDRYFNPVSATIIKSLDDPLYTYRKLKGRLKYTYHSWVGKK